MEWFTRTRSTPWPIEIHRRLVSAQLAYPAADAAPVADRPPRPAGAPLFDLEPYHAARMGAGLAVLLFLLDPPGISWLIIAAACLIAEWQTRTKAIAWPTPIREFLTQIRLAADPNATQRIPDPGQPTAIRQQPRRRIDPTAPVIPIRPLSVGEILTGALRATHRHWKVSIGFTLSALVAAVALSAFAAFVTFKVVLSTAADSSGADSLGAVVGPLFAAMLTVLALVVVICLPLDAAINGVTVITADRAIRGQSVRLAEVFALMRQRFWALCRLMIAFYALFVIPGWVISVLAFMAGGTAASLIIIPVLFAFEFALGILFSLSPIVMTLEGLGVVASLKRSAALAKPSFGRLLGLHLLWVVMVFAVLLLTYSPLGMLTVAIPQGAVLLPVYFVLFIAVVVPLFRTVQTLIYTDLRIREGNYTEELIRDRADNEIASAAVEPAQPPIVPPPAIPAPPRPQVASAPQVPSAPLFDMKPYHAARIAAVLAFVPVLFDPPGIPWLIIVAVCVVAERNARSKRIAWTPQIRDILAQLRLAAPLPDDETSATDAAPDREPPRPVPSAPISLDKPSSPTGPRPPAPPAPHAVAEETPPAAIAGPRRQKIPVVVALGTVAVLIVAGGATAWWFTHGDSHTKPMQTDGQLRYEFPEKPSPTWTLDAYQVFDRAKLTMPVPSPMGDARPGFIDLGDTLITTAILPQSDRSADLVAIDSDTGDIRWTASMGFHVSCASRTVDDLLPCFASHGMGPDHVEGVAFVRMSDGSIDHRLSASGIDRVEVVGNDIITAGYKAISRGSVDNLTEHWSIPWDSRNSCPGSGDAQYFAATDEFVYFGSDAGSVVVRTKDGKRVIDSAAKEVAVYPGHGLVAVTCPGGSAKSRQTVVLDEDGNFLRTHQGEGGFVAPLAVGDEPDRYLVDGTAYGFADGAQAWSFGGGVADVIEDTVLMLTGGPMSAVDFHTGKVLWTQPLSPPSRTRCHTSGSPTGSAQSFAIDGTMQALSLQTGAIDWSVPIGAGNPQRAGNGIAVATRDSIAFYAPTGGPAVAGTSRAESDDGGTTLVTKCGKTPEMTPVEYRTDRDGLIVRMELRATCPGGDILSTDALRVKISDSGQTVAAGVFDFSGAPVYLPGSSATIEHEFKFPIGAFWRLPNSIGGQSDPGIQKVGGGRTQLVDCVDAGTSRGPSEGQSRADTSSVAESVATAGAAAASVDPEAAALDALRAQADADRATVRRDLADRWLPQLSSKQVGLVAPDVDGRMVTWSATEILNQHLRMRLQYPEVRLVWSDEWRSFTLRGWWVTIAGVTFPEPDPANGWCNSRGIAVDECFAKLVSNTRDSSGTTKYRR